MLTPTKIKELCATYDLRPSKSYGQHYLISDAPIKKMIAAAGLSGSDTVVEIGPGFGVLTLAVAPLVKKVIAFEIEKKLQPYWQEQQKQYPNVDIVWGNFLHEHESIHGALPAQYKILANLPYQITSQALRVMLEAMPRAEQVIVMVQKEVAERMCAKPGDMSLLSVAVQYYGMPRSIATVPPGAFWPAPRVDSAVVAIDVKPRARDTAETTRFFDLVRLGFAHKRKQLWSNLASGSRFSRDVVKQALIDVIHNEKVRAEELSVTDWQNLFMKLNKQ